MGNNLDYFMTDAEEELNKARNIPAVFVNRMVVNNTDGLIRICFGDALIGNDATFRHVVLMTASNAATLADLLTKIVDGNRNGMN